jgi:glutamine synthetase
MTSNTWTCASPIRAASGSTSPFDQTLIDEEALAEGLMFDGSSIAGWRAINESDMT